MQDLGGGFIMLGGEQSFGLGGYYKSMLEEILPVRSDFEKEKEKPSLAMVLVIDKSGSMGGDKIEMAKAAAASAVELLGPSDQIAVIAFDGETYRISEMQSASNKGRISDEIRRIEASGGTTMYPAHGTSLRSPDGHARQAEARDPADRRHFFAGRFFGAGGHDGFVANHRVDRGGRIGCGRRAVGGDRQDRQRAILLHRRSGGRAANLCQGNRHRQQTRHQRAAIRPTSGAGHSGSRRTRLGTAPFLLGYVVTRPKPTSEIMLAAE